MVALTYMQRRASGTYEFRRRLPESLAGRPVPAHMGYGFDDLINSKTHCFKRELVRSLGTKDSKEAKKRDHNAALEATQLFDRALEALEPPTVPVQSPPLVDLTELEEQVYADLLQSDEQERQQGDDRRFLS